MRYQFGALRQRATVFQQRQESPVHGAHRPSAAPPGARQNKEDAVKLSSVRKAEPFRHAAFVATQQSRIFQCHRPLFSGIFSRPSVVLRFQRLPARVFIRGAGCRRCPPAHAAVETRSDGASRLKTAFLSRYGPEFSPTAQK